jgi:hypothetical protein
VSTDVGVGLGYLGEHVAQEVNPALPGSALHDFTGVGGLEHVDELEQGRLGQGHRGGPARPARGAAEDPRRHRVSWLQTNFLKTELELGHCLRTPAEGPCECDLVLTCSKFLTTSDYAPRLRARLEVEQQLIDDAIARGWPREIERHEATKRRLEQLLHDLA